MYDDHDDDDHDDGDYDDDKGGLVEEELNTRISFCWKSSSTKLDTW